MTYYKAIVAEFCEATWEKETPELLGFTKALTAIVDRFKEGGVKAAQDGRPTATWEMVHRWVLSRMTDDSELAGALAELLYDAWMDGYTGTRCGKWTS